jgi:hypothetical protein
LARQRHTTRSKALRLNAMPTVARCRYTALFLALAVGAQEKPKEA